MKYFTTCLLAVYLFFIPNFIQGQVIKTADSVIAPHQIIKVTFDSFPGNQQDWIALAVKGSGSYIQFLYLNGLKKGTLDFNGQTYGEYEMRGYYNNENQIRKTVNFRIGNKDLVTKITPTQAVVKPNDSIRVTFSGFPGNDMDYISIAQPGSAPGSYLEYKFLNKRQSGTLALSGREFGVYELRGYFNNENVIRFQTQVVVGDQTLVITPDKPAFNSNETIKLTYSGFPGNPQDWIGIAKTGTPATSYVQYKYLNSVKSGGLTFDPVPDGEYELRGYVNNEYIIRVTTPVRVGNTVAAIQTPGILNIQGVLTNAAGQIVPNGSYSILFRLYSASQGGSALWEENQTNVIVQSGIFSVALGKLNPFNIAFDKPYFLGIQFGVEAEMTPRVELTSTPYSLMAKNVENNSISTDKIQPNAVTLDKIAAPIVSSINGVSNDGGNINILAGANIAIVNDDLTKSITISAVNPGGGTGGISRINPGNAITVTGQDGPTATISVSPNSITSAEIQNNAVTTDKITPNVLSSLSGVSNDGGNINLIAGNNISIIPNDANKTITISAAGTGGGGTGTLNQLIEGNGIGIQNPFGPNTTIGLKPNILLGPAGSLHVLNQNSAAVAGISTNNQGGFLTLSNVQGTQTFGVSNFSDLQPALYLNSRLGRQVLEMKANEFSDGEMNLKSVLGNTTIRLTANGNAGGLINVFNSNGIIAAQLASRQDGDGLLALNNAANVRVVEIRPAGGGGYLRLSNEQGTEAIRLTTGVTTLGGVVSVYNRLGNEVAFINTNDLGDGRMFLKTGLNLPAMDLSTNVENGGGYFSLSNRDGNEAIRTSTYLNQQPYFRMLNRARNETVALETNELGDGGVFIRSGENLPAIDLVVNQDNGGGFIGLLNGDGNDVVRISSHPNRQPYINLLNRLGTKVGEFTANEFSDGELTLGSVLGNPTVQLSATDNTGGLIDVFNQLAEPVIRMSTNDAGDGGLSLLSGQNVTVLDLATNEYGGGFLRLRNQESTEMFKLATLEDRQPIFLMKNRLGNRVAELKASEFSDGQFTLFSVLTNPTVRLTANENAGGLINVFNRSGKIAARLTELTGGHFTIFNSDEAEMIQIGTLDDGNGLIRVNNRLGTPVADLMSNTFSDGQLTLGSVLGNRTVLLTANDNAGGLVNVFNKNRSVSAQLTESDGDGLFKIFNRDSQLVHHLFINGEKGGLFEIKSKFKFPENVAEMGANEDDEGHLYLFNRNSKAAVYLSAAGGDGDLSLRDIDGKIKTSLSGSRYGGTLSIRNENNEPVHYMGSNGKTKEGFYSIFNKSDINKNRLSMGGDSLGNGYLNVFNFNGLNTFFMGHNQFADGMISIKNSMGNLGALIDALKDGGSVAVTDGKPGTNHRAVLLNGLNGGRLNLFNNQTKLVSVMSVGDNGEGLWQIVSKQDLTKTRVELGGDNAGTGYLKLFNSLNNNTSFLGHDVFGNGSLEIRNNLGNRGGFFIAYTDGGRLAITDGTAASNHRGLLENTLNGGKFSIYNQTNIPVDDITVANNGEGLIRIAARPDFSKSRLELGGDDAGSGFVRMFNGGLKKTGELITNGAGGELNIFNTNGVNTSKLGHIANGSGALEIGTPNGNKVVRVTSSDGAGFIGVDNIDNLEVVRITANTGKGGGMALRNDKGFDMIKLTQDQSYGTILVNNAAGGVLTNITRNTANGAFFGTRDQNGKDALWITTGLQGGGYLTLFNALGKTASNLITDVSNNGLFTLNGSAGNEIARIETASNGSGRISIKNTAGSELAGLSSHAVSGGGYVFAQNTSGRDLARMSTTADGSTGRISIDNNSAKTIAAVTSTTTNDGALVTNFANGTNATLITTGTTGGGYIGVNNSAGAERAKLGLSSGSTGILGISNSAGGTAVEVSVTTTTNHGVVATYNSAGKVISGLLATAAGQGYIRASNSAGSEKAFMSAEESDGEIGVRDASGNRRARIRGNGVLEVVDADGSYFNASAFGSGVQLFLVDKFQHPRMEIKAGEILVKGPNGIEHSFMSTTNGANLGYIGVCNSNIVGSPVKAGMYTNGSNQGVLFADVKNFKMDYPGKADKQIWYGSLEGPELAAYIRGTGKLINGKATIEFTDHYQKVANTGTMTVILTPLSGKSKGLAVVHKGSAGFQVEELLEGSGTYEFDWEVKCVRQGHEGFEVVRNKSDEPQPFRSESKLPHQLESRNTTKIEPDAIPHEKTTPQQLATDNKN